MTWSPEQHREAQRRYYVRKRAEAGHASPAERAEAKAAGICPRVYRHRRARGATHAEAMAGPRSPGRKTKPRAAGTAGAVTGPEKEIR